MNNAPVKPPVFVALDTTDLDRAEAWAAAVAPHLAGVKIGLEFFYAHGVAGAKRVAAPTPLFLDLKLHDIPNTVAGGLRAVLGQLQPRYVNIHASGGPAMIQSAAEAVAKASPQTRLLAVTVLTSLDGPDLDHVLRVLLRVDVVRHDTQRVSVAERAAKRHEYRGLAGPHGPSQPNSYRSSHRCLLACVSICKAARAAFRAASRPRRGKASRCSCRRCQAP